MKVREKGGKLRPATAEQSIVGRIGSSRVTATGAKIAASYFLNGYTSYTHLAETFTIEADLPGQKIDMTENAHRPRARYLVL